MKIKKLITTIALLICQTVLFAQSKPTPELQLNPSENLTQQNDSIYYTCPMHPDVIMSHPGKCPRCGMTLEKRSRSANKETRKDSICYTCTKHPDLRGEGKPGNCSKCGMILEKRPR